MYSLGPHLWRVFLSQPSCFLSQVFGQTPFYNVENSQWSLWPEIPYDLVRFLNGKRFRAEGGGVFEEFGDGEEEGT